MENNSSNSEKCRYYLNNRCYAQKNTPECDSINSECKDRKAKMDDKEALKFFEDFLRLSDYGLANDYVESTERAIIALKRQLPATTQETQELIDIEKMCKCGAYNPLQANFCWKCGQNITGFMFTV